MKSLNQQLARLRPRFNSPGNKAVPEVEIDTGDSTSIFGRVVERKNFNLRPHLAEADAWAALRSTKLGVDNIPVVFAKQPDSDDWFAFLSVEDLVDLLSEPEG